MTAGTSAGTTIAISASVPATFDVAGYEVLPMTLIGEVTNIDGQLGRIYNLITHTPLATRGVQKFKGSFNEGSLTLQLAIDRDDAGQDLARAALVSDALYAFKIVEPTGDFVYFQAMVMSFPFTPGSTESIRTGTITLEITTSSTGVGLVVDEN